MLIFAVACDTSDAEMTHFSFNLTGRLNIAVRHDETDVHVMHIYMKGISRYDYRSEMLDLRIRDP